MKKLIYFDGGGGGIRAGSTIESGKSEVSIYPGFSHGEANLVEYLVQVVSDFANKVGGEISRAVLATAMLPAQKSQFDEMAMKIFEKTKIQELWICSDAVSSSAIEIEGDGVVIASGTGITALAIGKNRTQFHAISGDGFLIADVGSAFWIGRKGLSFATRSFDGRDQSSDAKELLETACSHFNVEPYFLPHVVHQKERPVQAIANFAQLVSKLAENGNTKALEIIQDASEEIALIANVARRKCDGGIEFKVALTGGVLAPSNLIYKLTKEKLLNLNFEVNSSGKTALEGAEILAKLNHPGVLAPLIEIYKVR